MDQLNPSMLLRIRDPETKEAPTTHLPLVISNGKLMGVFFLISYLKEKKYSADVFLLKPSALIITVVFGR